MWLSRDAAKPLQVISGHAGAGVRMDLNVHVAGDGKSKEAETIEHALNIILCGRNTEKGGNPCNIRTSGQA